MYAPYGIVGTILAIILTMDDKLKGTAEEVAGEVQEEWGKLTDNPAEIEKGRDKKMKGHYEKAKGGVKDKVEDLKEKC